MSAIASMISFSLVIVLMSHYGICCGDHRYIYDILFFSILIELKHYLWALPIVSMTFYFQALSIVYDVLLFLSTTVPPITKVTRQMMGVCSLSQLMLHMFSLPYLARRRGSRHSASRQGNLRGCLKLLYKLHCRAAPQKNWSLWSTSLGALTTPPFFSRTECVELKLFG
jgi:hypothetical protein